MFFQWKWYRTWLYSDNVELYELNTIKEKKYCKNEYHNTLVSFIQFLENVKNSFLRKMMS